MANKNNTEQLELIAKCYDLNNLSFLIGTGVSKSFNGFTMNDIAKKLRNKFHSKNRVDSIIKKWIKTDIESSKPNLERFLNKLYLREQYTEMIKQNDPINKKVIAITRETIYKYSIFKPDKKLVPYLYHFLNSLVNRKSGLSRVQFFTLNYDLLIDQCADDLGILLNDGFDGSIERWLNYHQFDLDFYYPSGIVGEKPVRCERIINYYKLHGSLNWIHHNNKIIKGEISPENMLIYPCQSKYDHIFSQPFTELFRRFSLAIKRPKGVLIVIGYGFGDNHINQIILQALEQPEFRLIIIDINSNNIKKNFPESQKFIDKIQFIKINFITFIEQYIPFDQDLKITPSEELIGFFNNLIQMVPKNEIKL